MKIKNCTECDTPLFDQNPTERSNMCDKCKKEQDNI